MTNEGLAEALKCVPLDTKHEIGILHLMNGYQIKLKNFHMKLMGFNTHVLKVECFMIKNIRC